MTWEQVTLALLGIGAVFLLLQRWFWVALLGLCFLAALFATIASVIHFQILGALGFAVLAWVLACCFSAVSSA